MEPFGLFQFLQNLLTPQNDSGETPPTERAEPTEAKTPSAATEERSSQNAAAAFLENHERRAGRSRS